MAVYLVTGKLGAGKTLAATGRAIEYAMQGRRVVSNYHIDTAPILKVPGGKLDDFVFEVIPEKPNADDLYALGRGGESEETAGLLILDECALILNSRGWNGKEREELIEWFVKSRRFGWDVLMIIQHISALDKQIRDMIAEFVVHVRRLDKMKVPFISWIFPIKMPRMHIGLVKYGTSPQSPHAETWVYRGTNLFAAYDTKAILDQRGEQHGSYCVLPPKLSKWRHVYKPTIHDYQLLLGINTGFVIWLLHAVGVLFRVGYWDKYAVIAQELFSSRFESHSTCALSPRRVGGAFGEWLSDLRKSFFCINNAFKGFKRVPLLPAASERCIVGH